MKQRRLTPRVCTRCGLLLIFAFLQISRAQEPGDKPEAPTPKAVPSPVPLIHKSSVGSATKNTDREPQTVEDLAALAAFVAEYIPVANCQSDGCAILVTDFTLPDGNISAYGMQLADRLSRELTNKQYKLRVIDRRLLQQLLAKDRVLAQSDHHGIIHWISDSLDARFIVFGITERVDSGPVRLLSELIDTNNKEWSVYSAIVNLGPPSAPEDLIPVEPFAPLPSITTSSSGEKLEQVGVNGTTMPSCTYMPNPPYTEEARKLNMSGSVTTEAVVNSHGELENIRVIRGSPGGLNETTIATMRTWRCQPALKDGKPVPVLLPFTTTFRLY